MVRDKNPGINTVARDQIQELTQWQGIKFRNDQGEKYMRAKGRDQIQDSTPWIGIESRIQHHG
jgi:hypothetical protein